MKRGSFPRFYFLSDDELLDILANTDNKEHIARYLKTLFDALVMLENNDLGDTIAMMSGDKEKCARNEEERVVFQRSVRGVKDAETWLLKI